MKCSRMAFQVLKTPPPLLTAWKRVFAPFSRIWKPFPSKKGGNLVPIIQGRGSQWPRWCPSCPSAIADNAPRCRSTAGRSCPSSTAGTWCRAAVPIDGGKVMPIMPRRRADHRPCRGAVRRADRQPGRSCPSSRATAWQRPRWCPWCPSCRSSTAGKLVPVVPRCRSTAGRSCPSSRATARNGRGGARRADRQPGRSRPSCRGADRRREAGADHPGPRPGKLVPRRFPVMPIIDSREAGARRAAVSIDGGKVVPIIQGHGLATAAVVPVVPVMPIIDSREAGARRAAPSCRSTPAGVREGRAAPVPRRAVPRCRSTAGSWCPSCRAAVPIDGGKVVPIMPRRGADRRREGGAHHPGPRLATAAVVPVVPIIDSREAGAHRVAPSCRAVVPIDGGKLVPVMPCRSSRATAWQAGAAPVPRRAVVSIDAGKVVPIDGGKVMPIMPRRRADHRPCRGAVRRADRQPGRSCPSSGATAWQWPRWCPWCPSCRSSTAGKLVPIVPRCRSTAGRSCPSSRATAWQRPRWCPWFPSCPSSTVGRSCRRADGGKLVPIIQGHGLASWCRAGPPSCRRADRRRPVSGKLVPRRFPVMPSCRSTAGRSCPSSTAGKLVPIIQGHGLATAAVVPVVSVMPIIDGGKVVPTCRQPGRLCPSSRATAWQVGAAPIPRHAVVSIDGGKLVPVMPRRRADRRREGRAHHPGPRLATAAVVPVVPCRRADHRQPGRSCPSSGATAWQAGAAPVSRRAVPPCRSSTAGKVVPIIQGHGSQRPRCPSCRSTAGKVVPVVPRCRADRRREGGARHAAPPCRSSTLPRWCPSCRSTAGKLVPIIQGHGLATAAVVPVVSVMPIIDGGKVVPTCRRREAGADHPGPRLATAAVVPVVPIIDSRERRAAVSIDAGKVVPIDGGNVVPIIQGHGSQRPRWCPSCRAAVPIIDSREGRAHHPGPRLATAAVVPVVSVMPIIDGGKVVPTCRRREAGADHPGPRLATAAVVPVVPIIDSRERRAAVSIDAGKVVPIDGGNVVPIIQGHGLATAAVVPVVPCRRADHRQPGRSCPSSGATAWQAGAAPVPRRAVVPIDAGRCPGRSCRSTAGRSCPSCRAAVPIIDLAAVVPVVPIDRREGRAHHRRWEGRADVPTAGSWCRSSRATAWQAGAAPVPRRAVVPIDAGRCPGSWCRAGSPSCRRVDRRREGRAHHRQPGSWCRSSRATAWQRPRWCPWFPSCPSSTAGRSCRRADSREGCAHHPGPRPGNGRGGARRAVPPCRSTAGSWCPSCRAAVPIDGGKVVPIIQGHGSQRPRWCPSCRAAVPIIDSREGRAHHPGPRPGKLVPRRFPVVPCRRADHRQPGRSCPSSRATARNGRGVRRADRQPGRSCPSCRGAVPIDAGKVVPVMPRRRADHRPCRGGARRADRQPGSWCPSSRATAWQRPRWCPWFPSCPSSTVGRSCRRADGGKLVPIIQGHGSQRPRWCPSCRSSTAGNVVPPCRSTPARWCRSTAGTWCPSSRATARNGRGGARRAVPPCRSSTAGKVVPIIRGHGLASWCRRFPVVPCRRADHRQPGRSCPSSRATARNGRGGARGFRHAHHRRWEGRADVPTAGSWCRSSRATARNGRGGARRADHRQPGTSCRRVDRRRQGGADRRRERGADHPGPRPGNGRGGARRAVPPCRSSTAGKVVPIIRGHGLASWCRAGPPSCRRADRRRPVSGKVVPIDGGKVVPVMPRRRADHRPCRGGARRADRQPGSWCPSSRATAWQRPRWCPWFPSCRSSTLPRWCPSCRSTAGKLVPIIQGHGLATAAVVPVVSVMPIIDSREGGARRAAPPCRSTAESWCRSSRATARNGRGGARPQLRTMRRRAD